MKKFRIIWLTVVVLITAFFVVYRINEIRKTDSSGPVISCEEEKLLISIKDGDDVLLQGLTASDRKDGDVTDTILVEKLSNFLSEGTRTVTYAAFDSDNHIAKTERAISYTDYRSPQFELSGSLRFRAGETVNIDTIVTANDCLDGDISNKVKILLDDSINNRVPGFYKIRYEVSNSAGDTVILPVEVEIYEASANEVELKLSQYLVYYEGKNIDYKDYLLCVRSGNVETFFEGVLEDEEGSVEAVTRPEAGEAEADEGEAEAPDDEEEASGDAAVDENRDDQNNEEADPDGEETAESDEEAVDNVIPKSRVTVRSQVNASVPGVYPVYFYYSDMQERFEKTATEVLYVVVE